MSTPTNTPPNTLLLKKLMAQYKLSCKDVAELLDRSVSTVEEWRCANSRVISDSHLALLQVRLAARGAVA